MKKPETNGLDGWQCAWCKKPMKPPSEILKHDCPEVPAHVRAADEERKKSTKRSEKP